MNFLKFVGYNLHIVTDEGCKRFIHVAKEEDLMKEGMCDSPAHDNVKELCQILGIGRTAILEDEEFGECSVCKRQNRLCLACKTVFNRN